MADAVIQLGGKWILAVELSTGMHALAVVPQANAGVIIGAVAIDQTTPGDTNKVAIREHTTLSATIANAASLSDEFDMREYAQGVMHMPSAWTAAFIGFHVSPTTGGTFQPLYDKNGNLVQTATAAVDTTIEIPDEVGKCRFVKLWSQDGAGANAAQGAERVIAVDLKA